MKPLLVYYIEIRPDQSPQSIDEFIHHAESLLSSKFSNYELLIAPTNRNDLKHEVRVFHMNNITEINLQELKDQINSLITTMTDEV